MKVIVNSDVANLDANYSTIIVLAITNLLTFYDGEGWLLVLY